MTKDRDFKRLVRARAKRTGESYQRSQGVLRPGEAPTPKLDAYEDTAPPPTEEERREGRLVAELALRMADGKPTLPAPPWTPAVSDLHRAALAAAEHARAAGATDNDRLRAEKLRQDFERLQSDLHAAQPRATPEDYLKARIAGRLSIVVVAREECRALLTLNPRDPVAGEACDALSRIGERLLDSVFE